MQLIFLLQCIWDRSLKQLNFINHLNTPSHWYFSATTNAMTSISCRNIKRIAWLVFSKKAKLLQTFRFSIHSVWRNSCTKKMDKKNEKNKKIKKKKNTVLRHFYTQLLRSAHIENCIMVIKCTLLYFTMIQLISKRNGSFAKTILDHLVTTKPTLFWKDSRVDCLLLSTIEICVR